MSDFVNRTVKVLDVLTLTVLLEQGDIDYTMCEYWDCTQAYRPGQLDVPWLKDWQRRPPTQHTCCLACLCKRSGLFHDADTNRSELLRKVGEGDFQITRVWLRTSLTQCSGCGHLPHKPLNPNWLDFIK